MKALLLVTGSVTLGSTDRGYPLGETERATGSIHDGNNLSSYLSTRSSQKPSRVQGTALGFLLGSVEVVRATPEPLVVQFSRRTGCVIGTCDRPSVTLIKAWRENWLNHRWTETSIKLVGALVGHSYRHCL